MLWGYPLQFWQTIVFWLWAIAAFTGGVAVAASFGSSVISYYISDATETAATIEINRAKVEASRANEAAGAANQTAGTASEAAAELRVRAGELEREAAEARREQERLKLRSLELELQIKKMGPRELTQGQINAILSSVKAEDFKPLLRLDFFEDAETVSYAEALANASMGAGMHVVAGNRIMAGGSFGLAVMDRSGAIQRALQAAGLNFSERVLDKDTSKAVLDIGRKPPQ